MHEPVAEAPHLTEVGLEQRQFVRKDIGRLLWDVEQPDMIANDLELSGMVKWLAGYQSTNPDIRGQLAGHVYRMIAFRAGFRDDLAEVIAIMETRLGPDDTAGIAEELRNLEGYDYTSGDWDQMLYWNPVMEDVFFVADSVTEWELLI